MHLTVCGASSGKDTFARAFYDEVRQRVDDVIVKAPVGLATTEADGSVSVTYLHPASAAYSNLFYALTLPIQLDAGEAVFFMTDRLVAVRSQDAGHPFYAGVYMTGGHFGGSVFTGGGVANYGATLGDPDFVNVVPSDQFLDRYVFFADCTYPETTLTVVRRKTAKGFVPVELDCAGELTDWQPLGTGGAYEYTWIRMTTGSGAGPSTTSKRQY